MPLVPMDLLFSLPRRRLLLSLQVARRFGSNPSQAIKYLLHN